METERLILRGLELTDGPRIEELAGDREIASTTLSVPHPYPAGGAEPFIRATQEAAAKGAPIGDRASPPRPPGRC